MDKENKTVVAKGEGVGGGMQWEVEVSRCKWLLVEWINNKALLRSTQNSDQYPIEKSRWLINTWKDAQHHSLLEECKSKLQWGISSHWSEFSSVQFSCSVMSESVPAWIAAHQVSLSITNSWSSLKLMSIESLMSSSHLILCHPLLLPPISPSIRVFSKESTLCMRWPNYWSFSFSISPSKEHPGLISFRMDWLDLLAVQGTLESSPTAQFKSINSSVLSFLHSPTLTSIYDHWKNHSLD